MTDTRVQDAYSLRCTPQVHGAARDTVDHAAAWLPTLRARTRRSTTRVVSPWTDGVESNGNFHGAPVALRARFPGDRGGRCRVASAERRTDRMLDRHSAVAGPAAVPGRRPRRRLRADDRPVHRRGHGQRAEAARLAPASVDSIPRPAAMQEDHVSMGWARRVASCAGRSTAWPRSSRRAGQRGARLDLRKPLEPAAATAAVVGRASLRCGEAGPGRTAGSTPELEAVVAPEGRLAGRGRRSLTGPLHCRAAMVRARRTDRPLGP